jgi:hypothetical protein
VPSELEYALFIAGSCEHSTKSSICLKGKLTYSPGERRERNLLTRWERRKELTDQVRDRKGIYWPGEKEATYWSGERQERNLLTRWERRNLLTRWETGIYWPGEKEERNLLTRWERRKELTDQVRERKGTYPQGITVASGDTAPPHRNFANRYSWVVSFLLLLPYPGVQSPMYTEDEAEWVIQFVWTFGWKGKSLDIAGQASPVA